MHVRNQTYPSTTYRQGSRKERLRTDWTHEPEAAVSTTQDSEIRWRTYNHGNPHDLLNGCPLLKFFSSLFALKEHTAREDTDPVTLCLFSFVVAAVTKDTIARHFMSPDKLTVASEHHQHQQSQQQEYVPAPSNHVIRNGNHPTTPEVEEEDDESLIDETGYPRSKRRPASPTNRLQRVSGPTKTPPPLLMPRPVPAVAPTKRLIINGNGHLSSTETTSQSPTSHYATPQPPMDDSKSKTPEKKHQQQPRETAAAATTTTATPIVGRNSERIGAVRPQGILVRKPGPQTANNVGASSSSSSSATVRKAASSDQLSRPKSVTFSESPAMNHKDLPPPQGPAAAASSSVATTATTATTVAAADPSSTAMPTWATTSTTTSGITTAGITPTATSLPAKQHDIPKVSFGGVAETRRDDQASLEYQALLRQNTLLQRQLDVLTRERNELRNNKLEWQRQQHMIAERLEMLEQQLREHWVIASSRHQQAQQQQHRLSQERASKRRSWGSAAELAVDDKEPEAVIINEESMNAAAAATTTAAATTATVRPTLSHSDPTSSPAVAGTGAGTGGRRCPLHGRNGRSKHSQLRSKSLPRYEDASYRQPRRRYLPPEDYYEDGYDSLEENEDYVDYYGPLGSDEEGDDDDEPNWSAGEYDRRRMRARQLFAHPSPPHHPSRYGFGPPPPHPVPPAAAMAIPVAAAAAAGPPPPPPPPMGRARKWLNPAITLPRRRSVSSSTPAFSPQQQQRRRHYHREGFDRAYTHAPPSPEYEYWEQPPPPRQRFARHYDEGDAYYSSMPTHKPPRRASHHHLHHHTIPAYGTST